MRKPVIEQPVLSQSLIKILAGNTERAVGAGVVIAPRQILTCAHVVNMAIARDIEASDPPTPGQVVRFRFHAAAQEVHIARFSDGGNWYPPPGNSVSGLDLCLLDLQQELPPAVLIARTSFDSELQVPTPFQAAGYPVGWENGDSATGEVVLRQPDGLYLLRPREPFTAMLAAIFSSLLRRRPAGLIHRGFSGGPVAIDGKIAGVIARSRASFMDVSAYMVPLSALRSTNKSRRMQSSSSLKRGWRRIFGVGAPYSSTQDALAAWLESSSDEPLFLIDHFDADVEITRDELSDSGRLESWEDERVVLGQTESPKLVERTVISICGRPVGEFQFVEFINDLDALGELIRKSATRVIVLASRRILRSQVIRSLATSCTWTLVAPLPYERRTAEVSLGDHDTDVLAIHRSSQSPSLANIANEIKNTSGTLGAVTVLTRFLSRAFATGHLEAGIRAELALNVLINHQAPPLVRRAIRHRAKNSPLAEVFPDISELDAFVSRADLLGAKGSGKSAALRAIERRLLLHPAFNSETAFSRPCWLPIYINLSDGDFQPGPGVKQCPAGNLLAFLRQVVPTHISVEAGQQVELSALRYLLTNSQSLADFDSLLSSPILFLIDVNSSALLEVARSFAAQCDRELPAAGYLVARQPDWAPSISEAVISISKPTLAVIRESLNCSEEFVCKALKGSTDAHRVLTNLSLLKLLQDTHQPREEKIDSYELMNSSFLSLIDVPELDEREQFVQWLFEPEKKSKSLDALLRNKFSMIAESLGLLKSRVGASGWIDDFLTANRLARMGKIGGPAGLKKLILSSEPSLEAMTLLMRLVDEETAISVLEELAQRDLSAMFRILTSLPRELAVRLNTRGKFSHAVLASVKPSLSDDATQYEARLRTLQSLSWLDPRAGLPLPMVQFSLRDGVNAQIGQFPVTRYQFEEFVRQDGYKEGALWPNKSFYDRAKQIGLEAQRLWELATTGLGNAPMTDVFFPEAVAFCNWLSKRFSGKFMLPTADQWLDAAGFPRLVQELISSSKSAIDIRQIRVLEGGNPGVRWSPKEMTPIGLTPPNQNGANDMLGCVWEWCDTWVMPENVNGAPSMTDGRLTAPIALRGSPHSGASTMYDVLGAQLAMAQSSSRAGFRVLHFPFENSSHHSGIAK